MSEAEKGKTKLLNDLKAERNRLQKQVLFSCFSKFSPSVYKYAHTFACMMCCFFYLQVVFRSDPRKFKKLRSECDEFMKLVATPFDLLKNIGNLSMQRVADQVHNWRVLMTYLNVIYL